MAHDARLRIQQSRVPARQHQTVPPLTEEELIRQDGSSSVHETAVDPSALSPSSILQLQRTIGNQAVQRLLTREVAVPAGRVADTVIQRRGTYEPIDIKTGSIDAIEEQEYGRGAKVAFTKITSCIGFFARDGDEVVGLHLGVVDENSKYVKDIDLNALKIAIQAFWPASPEAVYHVGMIDNWDDDAYQAVCSVVLNGDEMDTELKVSDKKYSAAVVSGKLVVSSDDNVIWKEPD